MSSLSQRLGLKAAMRPWGSRISCTPPQLSHLICLLFVDGERERREVLWALKQVHRLGTWENSIYSRLICTSGDLDSPLDSPECEALGDAIFLSLSDTISSHCLCPSARPMVSICLWKRWGPGQIFLDRAFVGQEWLSTRIVSTPASPLHLFVVRPLIVRKLQGKGWRLLGMRWVLTFLLASSCKGGFSCFDLLQVFCFVWLFFILVLFLLLSLIWKKKKKDNIQLLLPPLKNKLYLKTSWGTGNCTACLWQLSVGRRGNQLRGKTSK